MAQWARFTRDLFPHPKLGADIYRSVASKLHGMSAGESANGPLGNVLKGLGDGWRLRPEAERLRAIEKLQGTAAFRTARTLAASLLYGDHTVWPLIGYEGPSLERGGYLTRGFNDINWLEAPGE